MQCFFFKFILCSSLFFLICSCSLFAGPSATEGRQLDIVEVNDTDCHYDIELLGSARLSMSQKHYERSLEQSSTVLLCKDEIEPRTLVDIYRMRAKAYSSLYSEPSEEGLNVSELEPLVMSLSEYVLLDEALHEADLDLGMGSAKVLRNEIDTLALGLFEKALLIKSRDGIGPSIAIFESLTEALDLLHFDSQPLSDAGAFSGELSGRFYLERGNIGKAKRYFSMASRQLLKPINEAGVVSGSPLDNKQVSQLFYNLGGIYYKELLDLRQQVRLSNESVTISDRQQIQSLSVLAHECFHLSYQYDPNNASAIQVSKGLKGQ